MLGKLGAKECGGCHEDFYKEWQTTIHSQAWTDPYFQADWKFDRAQPSCRLCHTPLDRQHPHKVLGYRDKDKWDPVLEDNPNFAPSLQHQGVTCAACHYREGKIVGVIGDTNAPHPVKKLDDPNQVCVRCHVVEGDRWDTFFRFPPCGTVAEIEKTQVRSLNQKDLDLLTKLLKQDESVDAKNKTKTAKFKIPVTGKTAELTVSTTRELGCVQCHMPAIKRSLVEGGEIRSARQHLWRGGHDSEMVKKALSVNFSEHSQPGEDKRQFYLTLANTGAAHYLPTGTPDRHLTIRLRALDKQGKVLSEQTHSIKRTVMWRPFIIDLWDTRLPRWQPRQYKLEIPKDSAAVIVEASIRYHLLDETRRKRINYQNTTPISYEVFRKEILLKSERGKR